MKTPLFTTDTIERVKETVNLVEIVEAYTHLSARRGSYTGLCPFHDEKTPSFNVNPDIGLYHCFGCGASGDAISFIQNVDGCSFTDAVIFLATEYNVPIDTESHETTTINTTSVISGGRRNAQSSTPVSVLYSLLEAATDYYHSKLTVKYRDYLLSRGVTQEMIVLYKLGFSDSEHGVIDFLGRQGFTVEQMLETGVCYKSSSGDVKDKMFNRIVFPITNPAGRTVAFAGRVNPFCEDVRGDGSKPPKYLNTSNTRLYAKSDCPYGVSETKKLVLTSKYVCVCEGYFDVLTLASVGIPAVAVCGTSLSTNNMLLLRRHFTGVDIILFFDSDTPGVEANLAVLKTLLTSDQNTLPYYYVASYGAAGGGYDPADLVVGGDMKTIEKIITNREPIIKYAVNSIINKCNILHAESRINTAKEIIQKIISKIDEEYITIYYINYLSFQLQIPEETLNKINSKQKNIMKKNNSKTKTNNSNNNNGNVSEVNDTSNNDEKYNDNTINTNNHDDEGESVMTNIITDVNTVIQSNPQVAFEKDVVSLTLKYPHTFAAYYNEIHGFEYPAFETIRKALQKIGGAPAWRNYPSQQTWITAILANCEENISELVHILLTEPNPSNARKYAEKGYITAMIQGFTTSKLIKELETKIKLHQPGSVEYEELLDDINTMRVCLDEARREVKNINLKVLAETAQKHNP